MADLAENTVKANVGLTQALIDEKNQLERALFAVQEALTTTTTEKEQMHKLFTDFKVHFATIQQQCTNYQKRLVEEMTTRRSLEDQFEQRLNQMAQIVERKQGELDTLAQKMVLPVDSDILRMRIQKDLEAKFRFELESRGQELERTSDALYECRRQLEIVKTALEGSRYENEKFVGDLRNRHKAEIEQITEENHSLHLQLEESRDQEQVRKLRRDVDEGKRRTSDLSAELIEVRKERDLAKMEKNDLLIKHAKEVEEERTTKRVLQTENDKLKFKAKCLEDDVHKMSLKVEKKTQEAHAELKEKTALLATLKEKELQVDSLRRHLNQAKEDLNQKEQELESSSRRGQIEDKERGMIQRKEKTRLQREMDTLERNYAELDSQRSREIDQVRDELKESQSTAKRYLDERDEAVAHQKELLHQYEDAKKRLGQKQLEFDSLEKDYTKLQEISRQIQQSESNLQTNNGQLEAQKRIGSEEYEKLKREALTKEESWKNERSDMNQKLQDLLLHNEKVKDECLKKVLVYKDKYTDYKQKVKRANQQITVLTQRVARYEMDRGEAVGGYSSKKPSPGKGQAHFGSGQINEDGSEDYGDQEEYEEEEDHI